MASEQARRPTEADLERCIFKRTHLGGELVEITIRMPSDMLDPEECSGAEARKRLTRFILAAATGLCRVVGLDFDGVFKAVTAELLSLEDDTGKCRVCGCTALLACEDGCQWVNDEHTLCSNCVDKDAQHG